MDSKNQVKIRQSLQSGKYHIISKNAQDNEVSTDGSPDIGGEDKGVRPMELLLVALGSCSSIDIIMILEKQRQKLIDIQIEVTGEKHKVNHHSEYKSIHLHFELHGDIKPAKAKKAIDLSLDTFCSVALVLKKTSEITYDFTIINA